MRRIPACAPFVAIYPALRSAVIPAAALCWRNAAYCSFLEAELEAQHRALLRERQFTSDDAGLRSFLDKLGKEFGVEQVPTNCTRLCRLF